MNSLRDSRAFLIDLDGVLYDDNQPILGAAEAMAHLREKGYPFRFATNTTMRCRASLRRKLADFGIEVNEDEIFSAPVATARYLRQQGQPRVFLLLTEDAQHDFTGLEVTDQQPDFVVMGDMGDETAIGRQPRGSPWMPDPSWWPWSMPQASRPGSSASLRRTFSSWRWTTWGCHPLKWP
jgi:HAD superfamily hydrolase (TIGR01450 family)